MTGYCKSFARPRLKAFTGLRMAAGKNKKQLENQRFSSYFSYPERGSNPHTLAGAGF